jgi:hypothetical protein
MSLGPCKIFHLSDAVLLAMIGGTTANVLRHIFGDRLEPLDHWRWIEDGEASDDSAPSVRGLETQEILELKPNCGG